MAIKKAIQKVAKRLLRVKTFDGLDYWRQFTEKTKKEAQASADRLRNQGYLARVVKDDSRDFEPWCVYIRRPRS